MAFSEKDFIVAIELGSSKITGIAGRKKDGTMQILAYAEEKTTACIKRGVVYNIEKTYQCINSIINKLETVLKTRIARVYVGIGGQSLRSHKVVVKRNLLMQTYISNETIDSIRQESNEIPYSDYEVLDNFEQEYVIDQNVVADPVGVMGTNIEGEFIDIIAKQSLSGNVNTCFDNLDVDIVEELIAPCKLADYVLTDSEKRSGCVLVDLGADTTTVVVYKNNICRYLATIPLGSNNINKDFASIQIEGAEAEDIKLTYGDAASQDSDSVDDSDSMTYTTSDGRRIDMSLIKRIIESRMTEIVANVNTQIVNSNYSGKLLAGIVLTGGGANMKNIDKAFLATNKVEKVRIARTVNQPVVKTSNAGSFVLDNAMSNTIVSLLLSGNTPCGGEACDNSGLFEKQQQDEERRKRQQELEAAAEAEANVVMKFDGIKSSIRSMVENVRNTRQNVEKNGRDKKVRQSAEELVKTAFDVITDDYDECVNFLASKDKYKQTIREGKELTEMLRTAVEALDIMVRRANKENSTFGRFKNWVNDIVNDD